MMINGQEPWAHAGGSLSCASLAHGEENSSNKELVDKANSSGGDLMKEYDYIGLNSDSSASVSNNIEIQTKPATFVSSGKAFLGDTELRLGIGPLPSKSHAVHPDESTKCKTACDFAGRADAGELEAQRSNVVKGSTPVVNLPALGSAHLHHAVHEQQQQHQQQHDKSFAGGYEAVHMRVPHLISTSGLVETRPIASYVNSNDAAQIAAAHKLWQAAVTQQSNNGSGCQVLPGYHHLLQHQTYSAPQQQQQQQQQGRGGSKASNGAGMNAVMPQGGGAGPEMVAHNFSWPGLAPGRFVIPVPKVNAVPAKRPFPETFLAGHLGHATTNNNVCSSSTAGRSVVTYNSDIRAINSGINNAMSNANTISQTKQQQGNAPYDRNIMNGPFNSTNGTGGTDGDGEGAGKDGALRASEDAPGNKAPVIGWPPIRSFRKNTLAAQGDANKQSKCEGAAAPAGGGEEEEEEGGGAKASDPMQVQQQARSGFFVKAKVDGVKIGRKVDLKAYDSYDSLKLALQDMFQGYVNGHGEMVKMDLIRGNGYVLTHEDKEGDWMLVGDVPWEMFATTVKSLRIMRSSDARGLGTRLSSKLKA